MSDEREGIDPDESKVGTYQTDDDVEAHTKPGQFGANDEGSDDDGDVEAHIRVKQ